jgi:hypothetical protein
MKKGPGWYFSRASAAAFLVGLLVFTLVVTGQKDTTNTEGALWTFILFAVGVAATFYFGRQSVRDAANEVVRPQAKSAARRLITLGRGINSLREILREHQNAAHATADGSEGKVPVESIDLACSILEVQLDQQMLSVVDALEDWRQFDPEIKNELEHYGES